ncbi:MAG TPA: PLDc N-terminal domain-containing protein [Longimicrobiales bacterium]
MRHWLALGVLVLDAWALASILAAPLSRWARLRWAVLVVLLPFLGPLLWAAAGAGRPRTLRQKD